MGIRKARFENMYIFKDIKSLIVFVATGGFLEGIRHSYKRRKAIKESNKKKPIKALLTGPIASGKTTFLQHISEEEIPSGASGAPKQYKVKNEVFDEAKDLPGDEGWLDVKFEKDIKTHDYILFFFDINQYISDLEYREDVEARIDMIYNIKDLQSVVMIGTHSDLAHGNYQTGIKSLFIDKPYKNILSKLVYVDTRSKECVKTICDKLKS